MDKMTSFLNSFERFFYKLRKKSLINKSRINDHIFFFPLEHGFLSDLFSSLPINQPIQTRKNQIKP